MSELKLRGFNRITSGRSIPTRRKLEKGTLVSGVSIVSIQADQSRHSHDEDIASDEEDIVSIVSIQADQSRLNRMIKAYGGKPVSIVSIQADQSRRGY